MSKDSFWGKYKGFIIGAVIIALVVTIFTPAEIGISRRSLDDYDENKGQIANIKLVDKAKGYTLFEVLGYTYDTGGAMRPSNFYISAYCKKDDLILLESNLFLSS